jgi:hypothetical protein
MSAAGVRAERINLKPSEFKPIIEIPWKESDAKLDDVLRRIYREPNLFVRYAILAEYLKVIPVEQLGIALDKCIELEGTENPDDLVALVVTVWAERDPERCWVRVKSLLRLVGMDEGWLCYDGWTKRPRITVQDLKAIRSSKFWIEKRALSGFPAAMEQSKAKESVRLRLLKEFELTWVAAFGSLPVDHSQEYPTAGKQLIKILKLPAEPSIVSHIVDSEPDAEAAFGVALRRLIDATPAAAADIIKMGDEKKWPPLPETTKDRYFEPPIELLMLWADRDLPGMIKWVEAQDASENRYALAARGLLMTRIDEATRKRWLAEAKTGDNTDYHSGLIQSWAEWDPKAGVDAAMSLQDPAEIAGTVISAAYGPWYGLPWNTCHYGLSVIRDYKFPDLENNVTVAILSDGYSIMELWGCIDIDETARFGMKWLLQGYAPRKGLILFFTGHDIYPDEGNVIDRTFCALRVWAVVRPDEMKKWISTLKDEEIRKALTWLLKNPWGTGPE